MTIQMKTIRGTTTFDVTVDVEWEIKVPSWVTIDFVEDALAGVTDLGDLEEQVLQHIAAEADCDGGKLYEVTYDASVMTVWGRIEDVCGVSTDITHEEAI